MATMKDIAEALGVSIGTVSKGLNGGADISEALRKSILDKAVELGYTNSRTHKKQHRKMAVFIENMLYESPDDFGYDIVMGFQKAAFRADWGVDVHPVTPALMENNRYENFMLRHRYSAALVLGLSLQDPWIPEFETASVPTVLLDNYVKGTPYVSYIGTDTEEAFDLAVSHLKMHRHEKIAFLNGSGGSFISDERMAAFLKSMTRHGLKVDPQLAVYGYYVAESAQYHVPGMVKRGATAILCGNDLIASGVIACLEEMGYSVPDDISVIGYDDLPLASRLTPPLTTIRQNRYELGKCGFYTAQAMADHVPFSKNLLRPSLIVRDSTAIARPRLTEPCDTDPDAIIYKNPELLARYA